MTLRSSILSSCACPISLLQALVDEFTTHDYSHAILNQLNYGKVFADKKGAARKHKWELHFLSVHFSSLQEESMRRAEKHRERMKAGQHRAATGLNDGEERFLLDDDWLQRVVIVAGCIFFFGSAIMALIGGWTRSAKQGSKGGVSPNDDASQQSVDADANDWDAAASSRGSESPGTGTARRRPSAAALLSGEAKATRYSASPSRRPSKSDLDLI